jgi:hypothetical protein
MSTISLLEYVPSELYYILLSYLDIEDLDSLPKYWQIDYSRLFRINYPISYSKIIRVFEIDTSYRFGGNWKLLFSISRTLDDNIDQILDVESCINKYDNNILELIYTRFLPGEIISHKINMSAKDIDSLYVVAMMIKYRKTCHVIHDINDTIDKHGIYWAAFYIYYGMVANPGNQLSYCPSKHIIRENLALPAEADSFSFINSQHNKILSAILEMLDDLD